MKRSKHPLTVRASLSNISLRKTLVSCSSSTVPQRVGGEVGAKETIENELVKKTDAFKNGKIIYLDGTNWYLSGGGLQSMKSMIDEVRSAL